jgi:hypothetical protein
MRRFSIRGLMALVLVCSVGLAALKNDNELWAATMVFASFTASGIAVLGAFNSCGGERAWWLGFAVLCGGYLGLAFGNMQNEEQRTKLGTTQLLDAIHSRITPPISGRTVSQQSKAIEERDASLDAFRRIGHSLCAFVAGLLGGTVAVGFTMRQQGSAG